MINKEKAGAVSGNKIKMIRIESNGDRSLNTVVRKKLCSKLLNSTKSKKTNIGRWCEKSNLKLILPNLT